MTGASMKRSNQLLGRVPMTRSTPEGPQGHLRGEAVELEDQDERQHRVGGGRAASTVARKSKVVDVGGMTQIGLVVFFTSVTG
jgi:hypothetical protein